MESVIKGEVDIRDFLERKPVVEGDTQYFAWYEQLVASCVKVEKLVIEKLVMLEQNKFPTKKVSECKSTLSAVEGRLRELDWKPSEEKASQNIGTFFKKM